MATQRTYYVYIMTNSNRTLYIGVTNHLIRRVDQHKNGKVAGFASSHGLTTLVYFASYCYINNAILREKQLKGWTRKRKIELIEGRNPEWADLWPPEVW